MNTLRKQVSKDTLYVEFVKIMNGVLGLSEREAQVFSFLLLTDSIKKLDNVNHPDVRADILEKTGISESNLSRYLGTLKEKSLLIKSKKGKWIINDTIRPTVTGGTFELKFVLEVK